MYFILVLNPKRIPYNEWIKKDGHENENIVILMVL